MLNLDQSQKASKETTDNNEEPIDLAEINGKCPGRHALLGSGGCRSGSKALIDDIGVGAGGGARCCSRGRSGGIDMRRILGTAGVIFTAS